MTSEADPYMQDKQRDGREDILAYVSLRRYVNANIQPSDPMWRTYTTCLDVMAADMCHKYALKPEDFWVWIGDTKPEEN